MNNFYLKIADEQDVEFLIDVLILSDPDEPDANTSLIKQCKIRVLADIRTQMPNNITYVIERDGYQVGRLRLVETDKELYIGGIQLLPAYQGLGLGSSIICSLITKACESNKNLQLEVQKNNTKAKKLYLRLGFTVEQVLEFEEVMVKNP